MQASSQHLLNMNMSSSYEDYLLEYKDYLLDKSSFKDYLLSEIVSRLQKKDEFETELAATKAELAATKAELAATKAELAATKAGKHIRSMIVGSVYSFHSSHLQPTLDIHIVRHILRLQKKSNHSDDESVQGCEIVGSGSSGCVIKWKLSECGKNLVKNMTRVDASHVCVKVLNPSLITTAVDDIMKAAQSKALLQMADNIVREEVSKQQKSELLTKMASTSNAVVGESSNSLESTRTKHIHNIFLQISRQLGQEVAISTILAMYGAEFKNIVRIIGINTMVGPSIIMEHMDNSLHDYRKTLYLSGKQFCTFKSTVKILEGVINGLQELIALNLDQMDLNPGNILVKLERGGEYIAKICDFGLTRLVREDKTSLSLVDLKIVSPDAASKYPHILDHEVKADSEEIIQKKIVTRCKYIMAYMILPFSDILKKVSAPKMYQSELPTPELSALAMNLEKAGWTRQQIVNYTSVLHSEIPELNKLASNVQALNSCEIM